MKFEHKKQEVITWKKYFVRQIRYAVFSLSLVLFSLLFGVIGYHSFASLSYLDSFYMSSMILTGMGPVVELGTTSAKLFSSFYALYSGVAFLSIVAVFLSPFIHRVLHILHVEK